MLSVQNLVELLRSTTNAVPVQVRFGPEQPLTASPLLFAFVSPLQLLKITSLLPFQRQPSFSVDLVAFINRAGPSTVCGVVQGIEEEEPEAPQEATDLVGTGVGGGGGKGGWLCCPTTTCVFAFLFGPLGVLSLKWFWMCGKVYYQFGSKLQLNWVARGTGYNMLLSRR